MAASKLVISRAGLGALTDLSSLSKPAIIIPISGSHQEDNAAVFAEVGAVICVNQAEANGSLARTVESLLSDEKRLASLSEKISAFSASDACAKMAAVVDAEKIKG
jgi:UDP-N-acetylglucosamine--N-acetylmuramyl-(pentapeptide) pyrophosphoryl-undecaprenol N-acetylglucosamine transferase